MPLIVKPGWEQKVRDELGTDEIYVPDSFLHNQINLAEANIIENAPEWELVPADKKVYLEIAVICECAALVCPSMSARLPKKETGPHAAYELDIDWGELRNDLQGKRDSCLSKIIEVGDVPFFGLAGPGR
jgi:hypothetical protein